MSFMLAFALATVPGSAAQTGWRFRTLGPADAAGLTELVFDADPERVWARLWQPFTDAPAAWQSTIGGGGWRNRTARLPALGVARWLLTAVPGQPRALRSITCDSNCRSTVLASEDAGATWQELADGLDLGCPDASLEISPLDPNRIWTLFGGDVTSSSDGGRTWRKSPFDFSSAGQVALSPVGPEVVMVRESGTIYRSGDHGETFTPVIHAAGDVGFLPDGSAYVGLLGNPNDPSDPPGSSRCVAVSGGGSDGGAVFVAKLGPPGVDCRGLEVRADGTGKLWLVDGARRVWRSLDRGDSWQSGDGPPKVPEPGRLVPHPRVPGRLYLLGKERTIWRFDVGDTAWRDIGDGLTLAEVLQFASPPDLSSGGVSSGHPARRWVLVARPPGEPYGRLLSTTTQGAWEQRVAAPVSAFAIDPFDDEHVLAGIVVNEASSPEARLLESFDGGRHWTGGGKRLPEGPPPIGRPRQVLEIQFDPLQRGRAFAVVAIAGFLERERGGEWVRREDGFPKNRLQCFHGYCGSIATGDLQTTPQGLFLRVGPRVLRRAPGSLFWKDTRFPGASTALASDLQGEVFSAGPSAELLRWRHGARHAWTRIGRVWEGRRGYVGLVTDLAALVSADGTTALAAVTNWGELLLGGTDGIDFEAVTPPASALGVASDGRVGILRTDQGAYLLLADAE